MPLLAGHPLLRSMLGAGTVTTLAAIPPFLLSAQSVLMRRDLGFDERQLGLAVSAFFATAAVTALLVGRPLDRWGPRVVTVVSGATSALSTLGIAVGTAYAAEPYLVLLGCLALAGTANAGLQMAANLSVASDLPRDRQGLGYGIKQSAIPLSILLGGLAVPLLAVTVGWRASYLVATAGALAVIVAGLRMPRRLTRARPAADLAGAPRGALLLVFASMTLASMAANSLGAFLPTWSFENGLGPSAAGLLLSAGSAASIVVRVVGGWRADRRGRRHLPVVAADLLIGAVGIALVATGSLPALLVGTMLAFAFGWGWPGLLLFAVIRMGRERPSGAATSVQAGAFVGGALGPALFGAVVSAVGFAMAWWLTVPVMVAAAIGLLVARRLFLTDLHTRPMGAG